MDRTPVNSRQAVRQAWKTGSPFQVRKSNQRPKLRFKSPVETDQWLGESLTCVLQYHKGVLDSLQAVTLGVALTLGSIMEILVLENLNINITTLAMDMEYDSAFLYIRGPIKNQQSCKKEKTDYTYARSASYLSILTHLKSLEELAISYITPILSRRSSSAVMRPDEVPVTPVRTPRRRINMETPGSTRRSSRLASRNLGDTSTTQADAGAANQSYGRSKHVTTAATSTTYSAYGSTVVHAGDSSRSNLTNDNESFWSTGNHTDSGANNRSHSERLHANNRVKYIDHLYGLDEDDNGGEYSDTESGLANTRSSSYTTTTSWETHRCDKDYSALPSIASTSKSALLFPFYVLYWLSRTILTVIFTVVISPAAAIFSTAQKSSDGSSLSYSIYSLLSRCVHFGGVLFYRFFTSILLWDVWALTRIREVVLGLLGFGFAATSSALSTSTSATSTVISEAERLERNRKRRGCCLFLLLLLLLPFLFYLLSGAAPILLAALSKNETKVEETIDESAFFGASGCLKCLRKEELMLLISEAVTNQVAGLHSQIDTQNQDIHVLQKVRAEHESHILTLTNQLSLLLSKQDVPSKETLVFINTLETQLTSLKGELRNLQIAQAQQGTDADKEMVGLATLDVLRTDIGNMEESLKVLKADLKSFHSVYSNDVSKLQNQDRHLHGDVNIIGSRVLVLEKKVSSNMNSLERRLSQLQQALQGLESGRLEDGADFELIAAQIGVVEGNMTAARNELRGLKAELAAVIVSADKVKELENKMALNADVEVLRTQLIDLESRHTDDVKDLKDLKSRYQTVYTSVTNIQAELNRLQGSVLDIDANKYGAISVSLEQFQNRLSELENNSHDLNVRMQLVQDASGNTVDAALIAGLQNNFSDLETKLNYLRTELLTLSDKVAIFPSRSDNVHADQARHEQSTATMFVTIKEDIVRLQENGKNVVNPSTLNTTLNAMRTEVHKSTDRLSSDIGTLRTDLHRLEVVEGSSKLVGDVTKLQAVLESVRQQLQGLDTSNRGGVEPAVAVDLAELRSEIGQTTRGVQQNRASISSMNGTIAILQHGHQEHEDSAAVIAKDFDSLRDELGAMIVRVDELNSAKGDQKSIDTIQLEASTLQSHLKNVQFDVEALQQQIEQLSAKSVGKQEHQAVEDDLSLLQTAVAALQQQLVSETDGDISIIQLVNRVNALGDVVEKYEKNGAFGGGAFSGQRDDAMETEKLQSSLDSVQDELSGLQRDLAILNSAIFTTSKEGQSQSVLADIAHQLSSVETSLEGLRSSQEGINQDVEIKIGNIERLMGTLRDQVVKLQSDVTDTFGAAAGASVRDDLVDVKANLSDLNEQQIKLLAEIKDCCNKSQLAEIWAAGGYSEATINWTDTDGLNEEKVRNIVLSALTLYSADKTGMVDYALESAGGSVVSTRCSETYTPRTTLITIFGIPVWYQDSSPRFAIQPEMHPGNCWAFKGGEGFLVIQLSGLVKARSFSMEHIPSSLSPTGSIDSAPKEFSVWALHSEYDTEGTLLGKYEYDKDGNPLQFFAVHDTDVPPTGMVELKIHSNQGNMEYTCLYRFRVHGTLHRG